MAAFAVWILVQDGPRARDLAYRALRLNPNSSMALTIAGRVESHLANHDKGIELIGRALRLSPRDPREWMMSTANGGGLRVQRTVRGSRAVRRECVGAESSQQQRAPPSCRQPGEPWPQ